MTKVIASVHHVHLMNADMSAVWPPTLRPRASRLGLWVHRKLAVTVHSIAVRNKPHATRTHMPYGITQCYLPPGRADIPALTSVEASTWFSDPGGTQGWVDLTAMYSLVPRFTTMKFKHPLVEQYSAFLYIVLCKVLVSTCNQKPSNFYLPYLFKL